MGVIRRLLDGFSLQITASMLMPALVEGNVHEEQTRWVGPRLWASDGLDEARSPRVSLFTKRRIHRVIHPVAGGLVHVWATAVICGRKGAGRHRDGTLGTIVVDNRMPYEATSSHTRTRSAPPR